MSEIFPDFLDRGEPLPFEDLFVPLVFDARASLRQKVGAAQIALLRPEAHAGWERYLLKRLSHAGAKASLCQFEVFKTVRSVFSNTATSKDQPVNKFYREFVSVPLRERLRKLFEEFPALAGYCEMLVSNWIATVAEFLNRLETDNALLDANFTGGPFICSVVHVDAGLSDSHHGGRCVARLTFESGASLIYKPRSVAPEARFFDFLGQLNLGEIPHALKLVQCWERDGYGWMENVMHRACGTLAEVHAFYWRAGALLALVYLARGVDMHRENLIAAGEFPVLIDLEALWHPQEHAGAVNHPVAASVLRTGFLPQNNPQIGAIYDWNALSHQPDSNFSAMTWTHVNKDYMSLERADRSFRPPCHLPAFGGKEYLAREFVSDILAGFRWVGEKVLGPGQERESFRRWIHNLQRCPRRQIFRLSSWY